MISIIVMADGYYISTVRLKAPLADRAKVLAESMGISLNRLITRSVREFVDRHSPAGKLIVVRNGKSKAVTVIQVDKAGAVDVLANFKVGVKATPQSMVEEAARRTGIGSFDVVET